MDSAESAKQKVAECEKGIGSIKAKLRALGTAWVEEGSDSNSLTVAYIKVRSVFIVVVVVVVVVCLVCTSVFLCSSSYQLFSSQPSFSDRRIPRNSPTQFKITIIVTD